MIGILQAQDGAGMTENLQVIGRMKMSLQFIIGSSGSGKSCYAYQNIIEQAGLHPEKLFYVIVPEQFTMQTQKTLVEMSPGRGILNIDILSFERLAYRVLEEVGGDSRILLEETGKSMVLQKMVQQHGKELSYLGGQMRKAGYLDEVKSILSEFMQYDIRDSEIQEMIEDSGDRALLQMKLKDVAVLYQAFTGYLKDHYMTGEEVMDALEKALPFSEKMKNSVLLLDGYTGFTPIQMRVVGELLAVCEKVMVTVTMDADENLSMRGKPYQLFYMSRQMIHGLSELTREIETPVLLKDVGKSRFSQAPALHFLEKNIFRYRKNIYKKAQDDICMFSAVNPQKEMEEAARRIARLVREKGCRYGEIAVITGNLEEYGNLAKQVFTAAGIPYFIDEKHTVLMNPFVEYFRAALEMAVQDFSYESVFRFLRTGMTALTMDEIDRLDLYVMKMGIHGRKQYGQLFARGEEAGEMNALREKLMEEIAPLLVRCKTAKEYTMQVYSLCEKNSLQKKCRELAEKFTETGDLIKAKEFEKIYPALMDLLDQIYGLIGEDPLSLDEFIQIFEAGVSEIQIGTIPQNVDQVVVGDMERTRLKKIKALFFLGVNDGVIPARGGNGGLLSDMEREYLIESGRELAPSPRQKLFEQQLYLYQNMTKPAEYLFLSYAKVDSAGKTRLPSYLIRVMTGLFPKLHVQTETEENEGFLAEVESA